MEAITAFVIPRPGRSIDGDALIERRRGRLSRFKCPKAVMVVDDLPRTAIGKVRKHALRQRGLGL